MIYKKTLAILLVALFFAIPGEGWAKKSHKSKTQKQNLNYRIEQLEQEVENLKAEQAAETKQPETSVGAKFPVKLYGFVAAQVFWGSSKTRLYGGNNSTAAQSSVLNGNIGPENNNSWISFTPQNSRIGLDWTGSSVGQNVYIGGKLELDFLNILNTTNYGTSPIPRIRHFYFELWGKEKEFKKWSVLAGQTWDLFSPLNTQSLSLGGNLWFQGNMGFRRPQIRFTYQHPWANNNVFKVALAAANPANTDDLIGNGGVDSGIPYGELLVEYDKKMKHGDLTVAVSGAAGRHRRNGNSWSNMYGVAGSLSVPFHKFFKVSGEVQYGQDLGNFLSYDGVGRRITDIAAWGQVSSRWHKMFETNIGYGIDNSDRAKVPAGTGVANINRNQVYFANFKLYPVDAFYWGVEYNYMRTGYKGNGTSDASVVFTNLVYSF